MKNAAYAAALGLGLSACGNVERGSDSTNTNGTGDGLPSNTTASADMGGDSGPTTSARVTSGTGGGTIGAVSSTTGASGITGGGGATIGAGGVGGVGVGGVGGTGSSAGDSGGGNAGAGGADSCATPFEAGDSCDTLGETCPMEQGCCACLPGPECAGGTPVWQCVVLDAEPRPVCAAGPPTPGASCSSNSDYCAYCTEGIPSLYVCNEGDWDKYGLLLCL